MIVRKDHFRVQRRVDPTCQQRDSNGEFGCFVLWRTVYIPSKLPTLPPSAATVIRVASGMRQSFFFALCLSASISTKPAALIVTR